MSHRTIATAVFLLASGIALSARQGGGKLVLSVLDPSGRAIPNATVRLAGSAGTSVLRNTNESGVAAFSSLPPGTYTVSILTQDFQPLERRGVVVGLGTPAVMDITLLPGAVHKEQVEVRDTVEALDAGAGDSIPPATARELPSRPATVADALPLIPGVTRTPEGSLNISGAAEHRSTLVVNSADVTDPATGQFGTTVPIDSVATMNVYQTPFLAEYGRFTAGLVSVETRRGSDSWKWDLNDPLPDFRIRSYQIRGLKDATPRLTVEGPLVAGKLYFSEGVEYAIKKVSVVTLPFPENQQVTQGFNSFSQFDYVAAARNLVTGTFHIAPEQMSSVNMNAFNPQPTVPDASIHDGTATLADKWTIESGDLLDNTLSFTRFRAGIWPHGAQAFTLTPEGNYGNYFAQQQRSSSRLAFSSMYSVHAITRFGVHNLKAGSYFARDDENADLTDRPYSIRDSAGQLLEAVSFTPGRPIGVTDTEMAFFGEDHWLLTPTLAADIGLRAESQEVTESLRLAPRVGLSWTPFPDLGTVIRGGVGLYYDRVPLTVFGFPSYPGRTVTDYLPGGQIQQTTYVNELGYVDGKTPFVLHQNQAGDFSPQSKNWSVQIEHPVASVLKLRASYMQSEASGLVILDPAAPSAVSDAAHLLLSGNGRSRYQQFELTGRVRLEGDKQELFVSFVRSRSRGDINDFANYLGSFPSPVIRPNQFADVPGNIPNRILCWGVFHLPFKMQIAPIVEWRTGFPYALTNASQAYAGIPFATSFPDFLSVDARMSKDFRVNSKYTVRLSVSGSNLTRHFNPDSVYSNTDSPLVGTFFGQHGRRMMVDFDFFF